MPSPPIELFLTTIASAPALRQKQEYLLRTLQVRKIPFTSYDLASPESDDAKRLWKRKAPLKEQALPGILVGGRWPGNFTAFEEAVEFNELDQFLRLNESWNAEVDGDWHAAPVVRPVGVPGAVSPLQMNPEQRPSTFAPSPSISKNDLKEREAKEYDVGVELAGFGLQGVKVTDEDLVKLVEELGLGGDEAGDLVKGLGGSESSKGKATSVPNEMSAHQSPAKTEAMKDVTTSSAASASNPTTAPLSAKKTEPTKPEPTPATEAHPPVEASKATADTAPTSSTPEKSDPAIK